MRFHLGWPLIGAIGKLHILRDIHQNRSRPTRTGHMKGTMERMRQSVSVFDQPIVFGAWARDANGIGLLKCIRANHEGRHLPCQHNQRNAVHKRISETRHRIGCAGARSDKNNARLAGRARIGFGGMHRALLMANQKMLDAIL